MNVRDLIMVMGYFGRFVVPLSLNFMSRVGQEWVAKMQI